MESVREVLSIFEQVAAIPRASKHEQQISQWLRNWAAQRGFYTQTDPGGNLVIRVPGTSGYEKVSTIVLQGHMDMVCEKTPDSTHNFSIDPIRCILDGDWLHADKTTLGADNGIAIALAMTLVDDPQSPHPPLELLFTVEEETGLDGAKRLEKGFIQGKTLINLDSETEGVFIIGCAGGIKTRIQLPLTFETVSTGHAGRIGVGGLKGGHSGMDINKHRASANKLLIRALGEIREHGFRIADLKGGTSHNAIAREAWAVIIFDATDKPIIRKAVQEFQRTIQDEYASTEDSLFITFTPAHMDRALSASGSAKVIDLLQALPHGVMNMSAGIPDFVETSNNLARVEILDDTLHILSSQRSTVMSQLKEITQRVEAIGRLAGGQANSNEGYPAWQPNLDSPLLARSLEVYKQLFGAAPRVEAIHAGLECGLMSEIFGDMDMISIGATIEGPHSPAERLNIPSLEKTRAFLAALLRSMG